MFRKDLTPAKIQMRLPGLVWGGIAMEAGSAASDSYRCATFNLEKSALRPALVARSE